MEICNNPIKLTREQIIIIKILNIIHTLQPVVENMNFENKIQLISQLPKIMKKVKENEKILMEVFNKEFLQEMEEIVNGNTI